jgi:hypothetical protein
MSYIITIPSYNRAEGLRDKTLTMLKKQGVPKGKINIFVANNDEAKIYRETIPKDMYNKIIVGVKGLLPQLKFIIKYYPEGKHLVRFDDDIESVFKKKHKISEGVSRRQMDETRLLNLDDFIKRAFDTLRKENLTFWGINKTSNPFFMTDGYTTDLRVIVGNVNGWVNSYDPSYDYVVSTAENYVGQDIENTLRRYITDGGIVRFNDVGFTAGKYMATGGIQDDIGGNNKRLQLIKKKNRMYKKVYGKYGEIVPNKNQGEVFRLIRNPDRMKGEGILYDEADLDNC